MKYVMIFWRGNLQWNDDYQYYIEDVQQSVTLSFTALLFPVILSVLYTINGRWTLNMFFSSIQHNNVASFRKLLLFGRFVHFMRLFEKHWIIHHVKRRFVTCLWTKKSHYKVVCTGRYMSCRFVHYGRYLMYEEPESLVRYRKYTPKQVNSKFTFNGMS